MVRFRSIAIFAAVSIWVGLATNAPMLIPARVIQGIAAGLIMPLATAVMKSPRDLRN